MAQISIENLSFHFENHGEDIFKDVSMCIDTDWKLGLIGRNGRGKTTFLKILMGAYEYKGRIISPVEFEYFPIQVENTKQVALEVIREGIAPFTMWEQMLEDYSRDANKLEAYGEILEKFIDHDGYVINELIEKEVRRMKLDTLILTRPFDTLSGGEQTKLLLVALFLKKNHFLLIDEPTNHLDSEGRKCVANYLASKKGFIVISHDRAFIDHIIDHILSINKATIEIQKGNFSTWLMNKEREDEFEKAKNEKLKKEVKRLEDTAKQKAGWSNKIEATKIGNGPCNRGFIGHKAAKMMKRAKCIETRQNKALIEKSKLLKNVEMVEELKINHLVSTQEYILKVQALQVIYDGVPLFNPLTFDIKKGERVWLYGKNGCGKSSLLKVLMGEVIHHTGFIEKTGKISYVSQDTSSLKGMMNHFIKHNQLEAIRLKNTLSKLGLEESQFEKRIEEWSQGQKKKLLIAKSLCEEAQLYIWDEPLNFIDIISYLQIEELICKEKPTMLFVEHDHSFGEKIATKTITIE